jgi:phage terminase large subunit-like protein
VLLIDDPFKNREDADSPIIREKVWKWYTSTARTRLSPNGAIVIVHTRWHDEDLIGKVLQSENADKWERLRLPAIATKDEEFRKEGEALWATQFDLDNLNETKMDIGPYDWSALYQQDPVDIDSQEFHKNWFQYTTLEEVNKMNTRKFATIDTALSKGAKSDSTGVTRNYVDRENNWNFRSTRYRINSKELVDLIFLLHEEGFEKIGIEEGAYISAVEPFLKDEMKKRNQFPSVVTLKHGGVMKETRIRGLIPRYSSGSIFHIDKDCIDLEEEALRFPKGTHDDCIDSAAYQLQIAEPPFHRDPISLMRAARERQRNIKPNSI